MARKRDRERDRCKEKSVYTSHAHVHTHCICKSPLSIHRKQPSKHLVPIPSSPQTTPSMYNPHPQTPQHLAATRSLSPLVKSTHGQSSLTHSQKKQDKEKQRTRIGQPWSALTCTSPFATTRAPSPSLHPLPGTTPGLLVRLRRMALSKCIGWGGEGGCGRCCKARQVSKVSNGRIDRVFVF